MSDDQMLLACVGALMNEADEVDFAAIIIGFEQETRFVWHNSPHLLNRTAKLIKAGGKPAGILAANLVGSDLSYYVRPFRFCENQEWTRKYLCPVSGTVAQILREKLQASMN